MSNKHFFNIFFSGLPGVLSILLTFFSIPIFLNKLSNDIYANYLIQHFILSISMILNLNLGKIASIKMQILKQKNKNDLIFTIIITSFFTSLILSTLIFMVYYLFFQNIGLSEISLSIFIGLNLSILYITIENISKGLGYFKICSLSNFIFYSLSLSLPAFFLYNPNIEFIKSNLFSISVFIKFFALIIISFFLFSKRLFSNTKLNFEFKSYFIFHSKWMTLNSIYNQVFDYIDKYIIKINLGSLLLISYTIPQQIAAKLTLISNALIAVLLPKLSACVKKKEKLKIFSSNFYAFFYLIGLVLLFLMPFFDNLLQWWLKNNYNNEILILFKLFLVLTFLGCLSHIIISLYEANLVEKINTKLESYTIVPFLIGLFICFYLKNIIYFALLLLLKEIILLLIRIFYMRDFILNYKILIIQLSLFVSIFLISVMNHNITTLLICSIFIILSIKNFPLRLIKNEFFN